MRTKLLIVVDRLISFAALHTNWVFISRSGNNNINNSAANGRWACASSGFVFFVEVAEEKNKTTVDSGR